MTETLNEKQAQAYTFFQEKLDELLNNPLYKMKHVIIYDNEIRGFFDSFSAALSDAVAKYPENEFLIQQVVSDDDIINFVYSAIA